MKNKKAMKTNAKLNKSGSIMLAAIVTVILTIGTAISFFTDADSISNGFVVGNISIELTEPGWDPENGRDITPGRTITKDPQITNNGVNDAYVFMKVKIPVANIATASSDGSLNESAEQELFTYGSGEQWSLVDKSLEPGNAVYVYGYTGEDGNMKPLISGETTSPLFRSVTFINAVEGQLDRQQLDIAIEAMGIQTGDLGTDTPEGIYGILSKQIK